jgi:hypothetical protein
MASGEEEKGAGVSRQQLTVNMGIAMEFDTATHADAEMLVEISVFRPEYVEALILLAEVCGEVVDKGYPHPILVGGAAVEFHTGGAVVSGDFDFITPYHEVFEEILPRYGFILEEKRPGWRMRSFRHPTLDLGVEVLNDHLYAGSDAARIRLVEITEGKRIAIYPTEDLIADRLGQYAEDGRAEMLGQAVMLYKLACEPDEDYLDTRIRVQTTGDWSLARLKEMAA